VPLVHIEGVEIPLHGLILCDTQYDRGTCWHAESGQEDARKVPDNEGGYGNADNQRGATPAARRAFSLRRGRARLGRGSWRRRSRCFDRGAYHVVVPNMLLAECIYPIGRNTSVAPA
jgi:hypothetical protein